MRLNINTEELREEFLKEYQNSNIDILLQDNLISLQEYFKRKILTKVKQRVGNGESQNSVVLDLAIDFNVNENTIKQWIYKNK